jgi:hypothetical protein
VSAPPYVHVFEVGAVCSAMRNLAVAPSAPLPELG